MTNEEKVEVSKVLVATYSLFNRELSASSLELILNALSEYSVKDITSALTGSIKESKFCPTIADIIERIKVIHGEDDATLEAKANAFYNALTKHGFDSGCDIICVDPRAVFAFKNAFGSLVDFGRHEEKADAFDRRAFVEAYKRAKDTWYRKDPNKYLLEGAYHKNGNPRVKYIGKFDECQAIAQGIYAGMQPRLPRDPKLLTYDSAKKEEFKAKQIEYIDCKDFEQMLNELSKIFLH